MAGKKVITTGADVNVENGNIYVNGKLVGTTDQADQITVVGGDVTVGPTEGPKHRSNDFRRR